MQNSLVNCTCMIKANSSVDNFVRIIKERRKYLKINQVDLAEMSGVSIATIKEIERGNGNPSLATVDRILDVLGLELIFRDKQIF